MEDTTLVSEISQFTSVKKPAYSTAFNPERVTVVSNLFSVDNLQDVTLYQWSISFDPPLEQDSRQVRQEILGENRQEILKRLGKHFWSGEVFFCFRHPQLKESRIESALHKRYKLILKDLEKPVSLAMQFQNREMQQRVVQILNSTLKNNFKLLKLAEFGRSGKFYNMSESNVVESRGYKLNIRKGFHTNFDFYEGNIPRVLIDTNCRIVRDNTMWVDYMYCRDQGMSDQEIFDEYVIGKNFLANYGNYKIYNIARVEKKKTPLSAFPDPAKAKTFKEYFSKQYNKRISRDDQFLVVAINIVKKLVQGNLQEVEEEVFLVPELLLPTGLTKELRNDFKTMQLVANHTKLNPEERQKRNQEIIKALNSIPKSEETIRLKINPTSNIMKRAGLMLQMPAIQMANGMSKLNNNGRLQLDKGGIYESSACFDNWMLICDSFHETQATELAHAFKDAAKEIGLNLKPPLIKCLHAVGTVNSNKKYVRVEDILKVIDNSPQVSFYFVFLEEPNHMRVYRQVKNHLAHEVGKPSQFFKNWKGHYGDTYTKPDVLRNMLVQMCAKKKIACWRTMVPEEIRTSNRSVLMMGVDIFHKNMRTSVTSVVSNSDGNLSKYYSQFGFQKRRGDDTVYDLGEKYKKACRVFTAKNGSPPNTIVVLRDGVGDSQIGGVMEKEVAPLLKALKQEFGGKKIELIFMIVSKRISQKFSIEDRGFLSNPRGGLIVDSVATKDNRFEFFATTQFVNEKQGSAKPTHYNVVYNSTTLKANTIYELIYGSCFNYPNFQGGIKIPNLVMMANKQALHVGELYSGDGQDVTDSFKHHPAYL